MTPLIWTHHARERWTERVGDQQPLLHLDLKTAVIHHIYGNVTTYRILLAGRRYLLVTHPADQPGQIVVVTIKHCNNARRAPEPRRPRRIWINPAYNRNEWKKIPPVDEE